MLVCSTALIAENISRFAKDMQPGPIIAAARAAGVYDMIVKLPDGFDTVIGEGGSRLSAGQRQRIALARAFMTIHFWWFLTSRIPIWMPRGGILDQSLDGHSGTRRHCRRRSAQAERSGGRRQGPDHCERSDAGVRTEGRMSGGSTRHSGAGPVRLMIAGEDVSG